MYDELILLEVLKQTSEAAQKVIKRFETVTSVDYFTDSPEGMEKLDAICMVIIAIGESLKNLVDKNIRNKQLHLLTAEPWQYLQENTCFSIPISIKPQFKI